MLDRQRHPDFPDVPVLKEQYPAIDFFGWFGLYAPAGTPQPIVDKLAAEMNKVAREPDLVAQFLKLALRPNPAHRRNSPRAPVRITTFTASWCAT